MKLPPLSPKGEVRLIVGLGNPGEKFEKTRHNVGFMIVSEWARRHRLDLKKEKRFHAWAARGEGVHLLLPATYVNESGRSVRAYSDFYQIAPHEMLVVTDDVELPFMQGRIRRQGSAGGHNGLKSIEQALGTRDYPRLRIGIGRGIARELEDHVLGRFTREEWKGLEARLDDWIGALELVLSEPLEKVMSQINRREE